MSKTSRQIGAGPPRWAQRFVEWYCRYDLAEDLLGDLNEYFERNAASKGVLLARVIYIIDAIKFFRAYTVRRPKRTFAMIMIGSYIKTSGRNLMRNKLFSSINIVGLAISMSVGLTLISFIHDMYSFDRFHVNGDRIYRVNTTPLEAEGSATPYATSSIRTGRLIKEDIPGIEEITTLRANFRGDVRAGDNVVPLKGFWAQPSFLNVFTFPMRGGNSATALTEPYSMVLTESSATKLFGNSDALGKSVRVDTVEYTVTGIIKDIPFFSHMRFEALISFSTLEQRMRDNPRFASWASMWSNYTYLVLPENADVRSIESRIDDIADVENAVNINNQRELALQPLYEIAVGDTLLYPIGPSFSITVVWVMGGLSLIVILSACFNYTNLSVARSLRRVKEVGLRKIVGADRRHVRRLFLFESVIVSLLALLIAFVMFLTLRAQFLNITPGLKEIVTLQLSPSLIMFFIGFSVVTGISAGLFPSFFFANVKAIQVLKESSSIRIFSNLGLRRTLVVVQYTLTLIFITATVIGYKQYKDVLRMDLGFRTDNVLNIEMQGNNAQSMLKELQEMPEVASVSQSGLVPGLGDWWGAYLRYNSTTDSTMIIHDYVDENYFPLHGHRFAAGTNFISPTHEVIVNEKMISRFNIGVGDPANAIGEEIVINSKRVKIIGVLNDFHFGKADAPIEPVAFLYILPEIEGQVNVKLQTNDLPAAMAKIEEAWKRVDPVHPMEAKFYDEAIEQTYNEYSSIIKIVGLLSFLAITIASLGLLGMVVFTTETRLKEIGIRKVLGAGSGHLVFLLSRGFMILLGTSALIALPLTYLFFDKVVLTSFPFHNPIGFIELFAGLAGVVIIAIVMIGSQTLKAAQTNPAQVLKNE